MNREKSKFEFDDLHIAINRIAPRGIYESWMVLDMLVTMIVTLVTIIGLANDSGFPLFAITLLCVSGLVLLGHTWLATKYRSIDLSLAKIYAARVFDGFYESNWNAQYKRAFAAYVDGVGDPPESYVSLYEAPVNTVLAGHLAIAAGVVAMGFLSGTEDFLVMMAGIFLVFQAMFVHRALTVALKISFEKAYIRDSYLTDFKKPLD